MLTVDYNGCCGASSFSHYVLSHTRVVGCIRQAGLFDDQVVVDGDVEVSVFRRIYNLLVF